MQPFPSMMMHRIGGAPLKVTPTSGAVSKTINGGGYVTSDAVKLTVSGGVTPISFTWTQVLGDAFNVDSPTGSQTTFSRFIDNGAQASARYRCTVKSADFQTVAADFDVSARSNRLALSAWLESSTATASAIYNVGGPPLQGVYTDFVNVGVQGGTGNYTYEWYKSFGSVEILGAESPNSWRTRFVAGYGQPAPGITIITYTWGARCRVRDGVDTVDTNEVTVQITMFY